MNAMRLGLILTSLSWASCATSRPAPIRAEELVRSVLFITELADGTVTHAWQRAEEVELSRYALPSRPPHLPGQITPAMGGTRNCDEENRACMSECMSRPLPRGYGHVTSGGRGLGGKESYCNEKCMQPYRDCLKLQSLQPQEFTAVNSAMDWLKNNRKSVLIGSVVIIAGVAFVVVSASVGAVILAPAVLLSDVPRPHQPLMVEVSP